MLRTSYWIAASFAGLFTLAGTASGQDTTSVRSHITIVKLVQRGGAMPYAFAPASVTVQRGDTVRFVEDAGVMHNVHFTTHPKGAKLGSITAGPYLTNKGQTYDVVIDGRFVDGKYEFVCDPHAAIGMRGALIVADPSATGKGDKK